MSDAPLRHSPLDDRHRARGARMVPFGGWDMPLQYASVLEEHRACRTRAVMFDVSHLGTIECHGPGAFDLLQWLLTNDLRKIEPGRAQYTHLLDPTDAHVVDDIIVWWVDADRFFVMPNASNTDELLAAFDEGVAHTDDAVEFADVTATRAVLAVQGPEARALLTHVDPEAAATPRFAVRRVGDLVVAGTGYTGEDGVELHVGAGAAPALWDALCDPPGSAHATRCGSRRASRCTVTSLGRVSRRCKRDSGGWSAGTRASSAATAHSRPSESGGSAGACGGCRSRGGARRARDRGSCATARRSAR